MGVCGCLSHPQASTVQRDSQPRPGCDAVMGMAHPLPAQDVTGCLELRGVCACSALSGVSLLSAVLGPKGSLSWKHSVLGRAGRSVGPWCLSRRSILL